MHMIGEAEMIGEEAKSDHPSLWRFWNDKASELASRLNEERNFREDAERDLEVTRKSLSLTIAGLRVIAEECERNGAPMLTAYDAKDQAQRTLLALASAAPSSIKTQERAGRIDVHPALIRFLAYHIKAYADGPLEGAELRRWAHNVVSALKGVVDERFIATPSMKDEEAGRG